MKEARIFEDNELEEMLDEFIETWDEDKREISYCIFEDSYKCKCTSFGSDAHYDKGNECWYPPETPDYDIKGYEKYENEMAKYTTKAFCDYYNIKETPQISEKIRDNLLDVYKEGESYRMLDEDEFEEKAIKDFEYKAEMNSYMEI